MFSFIAVTQQPKLPFNYIVCVCVRMSLSVWQRRFSSFTKQARLENDTLEVKLLISFKYD